jgi:Integral membrane protein CcmA involved in cell shape determination
MKGEIVSFSEVQIDGEADLNMETENLMIGQLGKLKGDIKTKNADVWGEFDGDIECSSTLTIQEKGVVKGTTKYSSLQIKLGGQLQGDVQTLEKPKIKAVPTSSEASNSNK